jgi:hypothetical protein
MEFLFRSHFIKQRTTKKKPKPKKGPKKGPKKVLSGHLQRSMDNKFASLLLCFFVYLFSSSLLYMDVGMQRSSRVFPPLAPREHFSPLGARSCRTVS